MSPKEGHHLYKLYHQLRWRNPGSGSQTESSQRVGSERIMGNTEHMCASCLRPGGTLRGGG